MAHASGIDRIQPGEVIDGQYEVVRVLGEGGMGIVVEARDRELDRRVALKIVRRGLLDSDEAAQRFQLEARALASVHGPHAVRVFDVGRLADGTPYMVMEYLEGADLGAIGSERGPLPITLAVDWIVQACAGLAEAHRAGLVHRDLKPGNLFLARHGDGSELVKVLDFGVAKSVAGGPALTKDGFVLGSPDYMSPEQLQSSRTLDARTDVWALGAILYRLLTGRTPFLGGSLEQRLRAILADQRPPLSELRPEVPAGLEAVVDRCLIVDREQRMPSVAALARSLAPFASVGARELVGRIARLSGEPAIEASAPDAAPAFADEAPPSVPPQRRGPAPTWKLTLLLLALLLFAALIVVLAQAR